MRKIVILIVVCFSFSTFAARKQAVGVMLGSPTGISYHYHLKDSNTIDAGVDYRLGDKFNVHSTYLWHAPKKLKVLGQLMGWYYGAGARVRSVDVDDDTEVRIGARGSSGLLWAPESQPLEVFAEGAAVMNLIPGTSFDAVVALGARFVF